MALRRCETKAWAACDLAESAAKAQSELIGLLEARA